ncbi:ABC transporter permease [Liquorilactobacillus uvarum]|uniref:Protein ecsb n=1 Tax=Liquorilactobacillus uvarum DSM 19971 TaxID=1423812 RepID=A0A0R1Q8Q6_9LACO|nr:ABC transporter permease [Liquorilactobacillus uvarum]KRL38594.1 protein ecsb [Liquorilactobacillus uvarum DSM 19971]
MNNLWNVRLKKYQRMLLRYSKFVLNDHFVLALLFLVGGLGLGYSNFLKSLPDALNWWSKPLIVVIFVLVLQIGSFVSLLDGPDTVFLLPLENKMFSFLKRAFRYSFFIASCFQSLCVLIAVPFLQQGVHLTGINIFLLWLIQLLLKEIYLGRFFITSYSVSFDKWWIKLLFEIGGPSLVIIVALYVSALEALILTIAISISVFYFARKAAKQNVFRWKRMLQIENHRMMGLYHLINLFTDVPQVKGKIHRFKLLDVYLPKMKSSKDVFKFLYWRALIRKGEYSNLFLRLSLLGFFILMFIPNILLAVILTILFLYLIGFQLLPLYNDYDDIIFTHIYPLKRGARLSNFRGMLRILLLVTGILFVVASVFARHSLYETLGIAGATILMIIILTGNFLTKYAAKNT